MFFKKNETVLTFHTSGSQQKIDLFSPRYGNQQLLPNWYRTIRSEEHTSELQSHSEISYAVFCLKKKKTEVESLPFLSAERRSSVDPELCRRRRLVFLFFFFNDTATTEIYTLSYTLSLHDALPICHIQKSRMPSSACDKSEEHTSELQSHSEISYAVLCLKQKTQP